MPLNSDAFAQLIRSDLGAVIFVRDYVQLQFEPGGVLSAFTPVMVSSSGVQATFGDAAFANLILAQIGKVVGGVDFRRHELLAIRFEDRSTIAISLRLEDYPGPEALTLDGRDHPLLVVRADS
jgi:hypothetical protein